MAWRLIFVVMIILTALYVPPGSVEASGPWKAQVVDTETGKPLEGVVVLAYWLKYARTVAGKAGARFYDAEEVVTGPDGRFVIEARQTWTLNPFRTISGPEFVIFKPGHGQWRFRNADLWLKLNLPERHEVLLKVYQSRGEKDLMVHFQNEMFKTFREGSENMSEVVIELPLLKTREERLKFYQSPGRTPPGIVPAERMRHFQEAENAERAYLGFRN